jgi:Kef-type K+ transport system membrane component KefB
MSEIFIQVSLVLIAALAVSFIMRILKQPLVIGYIFAGILISIFSNAFSIDLNISLLDTFSKFGIAFLLFIVGIHLNPRVIKEVGKISLITGVGQVIFTSLFGYLIALLFGFSSIVSLYLAIALTFSSTIIIMKLLSDKDSLDKLYGKISIGFLLVQDFIAILILLVLSSLSSESNTTSVLFSTFLKGGIIIGLLIPVSIYFLPKMSRFFARSQELLFLFAITWGLSLASLFFFIGFSLEIGALIAGIMLSISPYSYEISSKMKSLREFFIIFFFLVLGSHMMINEITGFIFPVIVFSFFILIGNPFIVMVLMGILGYRKRTGFMAGLTVAQISEFSLILIAFGVSAGHLPPNILPFVTLIGLITISGSTYMILYSDKIYTRISRYLSVFERKTKLKDEEIAVKNYEVILFGYNRIGFNLLNSLKKTDKYLEILVYILSE